MNTFWVASSVALWIIVAVLAFIVVGLLRQLGLIQLRLGLDPGVLITQEGLERGTEAPDFDAIDVEAQQPTHLSAFRGRQVLLVFLATDCTSCRDLVPHLNNIAYEYRDGVETIAVCHGAVAACGEFAHQTHLGARMLADPTNAIADRYGVRFTPFAYLIDAAGVILIRGVVNTWPQLDALLKEEGTIQTAPWESIATPEAARVEGKVTA